MVAFAAGAASVLNAEILQLLLETVDTPTENSDEVSRDHQAERRHNQDNSKRALPVFCVVIGEVYGKGQRGNQKASTDCLGSRMAPQ